MKRLLLTLFLGLILFSCNNSLPECQTDDYQQWSNCQGTYTYPGDKGGKYIGEFKDGKRHGQGTQTYPNETKYVGEWKYDKRHGQGTFLYPPPSDAKYVGEWKDNNPNGQGTYIGADGDQYVGEWKDGKQHGQGSRKLADGDQYIGEWKDGKRHGLGTLKCSSLKELSYKNYLEKGMDSFTIHCADGTAIKAIWNYDELEDIISIK